MLSQKLKVSIVLVLVCFVAVGAKAGRRPAKKQQTAFEKLKGEYLVYKNSTKKLEEGVLGEFLRKFEKLPVKTEVESGNKLYYIGDIHQKLFEVTGSRESLQTAYDIYLKLSKHNASYGLAAQKKVQLLKELMAAPESKTPDLKAADMSPGSGPPGEDKTAAVPKQPGEPARLKAVKYWTNEDYTRVVIELSDDAEYEYNMLQENLDASKPRRIFVDLKNSVLSESGQTAPVVVKDNLLEQVRIGQYKKDVIRVVLDMRSFSGYKVFTLKEPFRIMIDIYGKDLRETPAEPTKKEEKKLQETALANLKNLRVTVKKIVLDAGHGDHDPGAVGYKGLKEKDVVLDIAMKLGKTIKDHFPDIEVIFTRKTDSFLQLEERTAIANTKKADLFISVHANASRNHAAHGIETYFLNFAKEKRAMEVVARENAISLKGVDEVQLILRDLILSSKYNESSMLASLIQENLVNRLSREYVEVNNLGVKQGPFYVLLGAAMPSVLVETSFISNQTEGQRLADEQYRSKVAEGIFEGVREYILKTAVAATGR